MSVYIHESGFEAVDVDGVPRLLTKLPPEETQRKLLKSFASTGQMVPESEWVDIDRRSQLTFILNQYSKGSCVGYSSARALMAALNLMGEAPPKLSGSFVYGHINGNRDNGAMITDALAVLRDTGACLDSQCPWDVIYRRNFTPEMYNEAKKYRLLEAYTADTWAEVMSAVQLGFVPIYAVMVGSNFMNADANGILGFDRGPGNHAVTADGCKKINGVWTLDLPNSWGTSFAQGGRGRVTQRHIDSVQQDCYVIRAAVGSPDDPNQPPAAP